MPSGPYILELVLCPATLSYRRTPATRHLPDLLLPHYPPRPLVPLPVSDITRPTLYNRGASIVPSHVISKHKSIVKGVSVTKRQKTKYGNTAMIKSSVRPLEEEEDTRSLTEDIKYCSLRKRSTELSNPSLCPSWSCNMVLEEILAFPCSFSCRRLITA